MYIFGRTETMSFVQIEQNNQTRQTQNQDWCNDNQINVKMYK